MGYQIKWASRPTTCRSSRQPTAWPFKGYAPAVALVNGKNLAGPAAAELYR